MPLTLTLSEGVVPQSKEAEAVKRLTGLMLKWHDLSGNTVMTPNVTAMVQTLPRGRPIPAAKCLTGYG